MIVGENRKGPQSWRKGREGDREHSSERESSTKEDEEPSPRRRDNSGIIYVFCFVLFLIKHTFVARHPWLPRPPSLNPEPYYMRISFSQRKSASDQCEERTACEPVIAEVWWYRPGLQKVRIRFWKGKKVISAFPHWPLLSMPWALLLLFYKTAESYEYLLHIHERWWATSVYSALWQLSA